MKPSFLEYTNELKGFNYFCKKTGNQIFKWQLFINGLTPHQVRSKYNLVSR